MSEEKKYLLTRSDVVFVHSMIVAGLDYRGYLEANEYHERTCHLVNRGTAVEGCADVLLCDTCGGATYNTYPSPSYCPNCGAKVVEE